MKSILSVTAMALAISIGSFSISEVRADEGDTFLTSPDDTFYIDEDGPDQDPMYDTDDPVYDELDDLDAEEEEEEEDPHC